MVECFLGFSYLLWLLAALLVAAALFDAGFILLIQHLIDQSVSKQAHLHAMAWFAFFTILGLGLVREIIAFAQKCALSKLSNAVSLSQKKQVMQKLLGLSLNDIIQHDAGFFTTHIQVNIETLRQFGARSLVTLFRECVTLIGSLIAITYIHIRLTLMFSCAVPIAAMLSKYFSRRIHRFSEINLCTQRTTVNAVLDTKLNFEQIKLRQLQDQMSINYDHALQQNFRANHQLNIKSSQLTFFVQMTVMLVFATIIFLLFSGRMGVTVGVLASFVVCFARIRGPLKNLTAIKAELEQACVSVRNLMLFFDMQEAEAPAHGKTLSSLDELSFHDVCFSYANTDKRLLNHLDLNVVRGQSILMVGQSGSGKTTVLQLICGFLPPQSGEININNTPWMRFQPASVQRRIALVSQNSALFANTLRFNLTLGDNNISDQACLEMLHDMGLSTWYDTLPNGLETTVGDAGVGSLSGGQKQRVCLARALLSDFDLLLLDEAFSGIDPTQELTLQQHVIASCAQKMLIAITHRYQTACMYDRVLLLQDGCIEDLGAISDSQLLERRLHPYDA